MSGLGGKGIGVPVGGGGAITQQEVLLDTLDGHGSTNTAISTWANNSTVGTDLTYSTSATDGDKITVNTSGVYTVDIVNSGKVDNLYGASLNATEFTTIIRDQTDKSKIIVLFEADGARLYGGSCTRYFTAADVIRPHDTKAVGDGAELASSYFRVTRVG